MKINHKKYRPLPLLTLALVFSFGGGSSSIIARAAGAPATDASSAPASPAATSKIFPRTCYSNIAPGESINTYGGFAVSSNIWNPGSSAYEQCTSATINLSGGVTSAEFDWNFASTSSDVKTYPNIQFGQQNSYRASTTHLLPALISSLPSLTATGTITTTCTKEPCHYDTAFDVFVSKSPNAAPQIEGELMIMTDYNLPGLGGFATRTPVTIDGATYNIRQFQMQSEGRSWPYVAYFATTPVTQIKLNINHFVADAVTRGYIPGSYYVDMVSVGTEVLTGHGITKITNYNIQ